MTLEYLLNSLMITDSKGLGLLEILLTIMLPFLLNLGVAYTYRKVQSSKYYSASFVKSLFLFSSLTAIITLIIGSNIARAFGLVGALSIIRFRTALKLPMDSVFVFWSLAIGMACGTGFYLAAILMTLLCGGLFLLLEKIPFLHHNYKESMLKVSIEKAHEQSAVALVEKQFTESKIKYNRVNILFNSELGHSTYVYALELDRAHDLEATLGKLVGVVKVHHLNNEASLFI